jgi:PHAX RNA-binding domain
LNETQIETKTLPSHATVALKIAQHLHETTSAAQRQILHIVWALGVVQAWALLLDTLEIEEQGGMMLPDSSRPTSPQRKCRLRKRQASNKQVYRVNYSHCGYTVKLIISIWRYYQDGYIAKKKRIIYHELTRRLKAEDSDTLTTESRNTEPTEITSSSLGP